MRWLVSCVGSALTLVACAPQTVDWTVEMGESVRSRAVLVELSVLEGGCEGTTEVYAGVAEPGSSATESMALEPGRYGIRARARDVDCQYIAEACREVSLPAAELTLSLVETAGEESACAAGERCVAGACLGGELDAGLGDGCAGASEICDGLDNDCDGAADEGFDLDNDVDNCGACGTVCESPAGAPVCTAGRCGVMCPSGLGDCDGDPTNGCETDLASAAGHCGACGRACGVGVGCTAGACDDELIDLTVGDGFSCGVTGAGKVLCWGAEIGVTPGSPSALPVEVPGISGAVRIGAGRDHVCVALADGGARCWGLGRGGQLGDGTSENRPTAVDVLSLSDARVVAAGDADTCVTTSAEAVQCWGLNDQGQVGDGTMIDRRTPTQVALLSQAADVSVGRAHGCALRSNGEVRCWGANDRGQIGDGDMDTVQLGASAVLGVTDAIAVGVGRDHACVALAGGGARCWGDNASGQLGDGFTRSSNEPVDVESLADATGVSGGAAHTCATRASGAVACWGDNGAGQLGSGTTGDLLTPTDVVGVGDAVQVAAGVAHTCARSRRGGAWCWGDDSAGQLGRGGALIAPEPREVVGIRGAVGLASGADHVCARRLSGLLICWGENDGGEIGFSPLGDQRSPVVVDGPLADVRSVGLGSRHGCAVRETGGIVCWGQNGQGQLGDGTTTDAPTPIAVTGVSTATQVSAGGDQTCARLDDGGVRCWGANADGQLGDGTTIPSRVPVAVAGISDAVAVSVGTNHACALRLGGEVLCWGGNAQGQVGVGAASVRETVPRPVAGLAAIDEVSAGEDFTCARSGAGALWCWGTNADGQLGGGALGGTEPSPVAVSTLSDAVSLTAGVAHTCAVRRGGGVECWGRNSGGQLGDGLVASRGAPAATVPPIESAVSVVAGLDHSCARLAGGSVLCWGLNRFGQIGDGTADNAPAPSAVSGLP